MAGRGPRACVARAIQEGSPEEGTSELGQEYEEYEDEEKPLCTGGERALQAHGAQESGMFQNV